MTVDPPRLQRLVGAAMPAAMFFALQAVRAFQDGSHWFGFSLVLMSLLVAGAGFVTPVGRLGGWAAAGYMALLAVGVVAWILSERPIVRVLGFVWIVAVQIAFLVLARRVVFRLQPSELEPDRPVTLGLHRESRP